MTPNGPTNEKRDHLARIKQQVYVLFALNYLNRGEGVYVLADAIIETMTTMLNDSDMTKEIVIGRMKDLAKGLEADGIEAIEKKAARQVAKPKQEAIFDKTVLN